jgi:tetratricopeptide (TPR) repeat protein
MYPVRPLAPTPAAELFLERVAQAAPSAGGWDPSLAVQICRRLDGLPLAIELAAARTRILSPAALLDRLDQALAILTHGARDLPVRQQGLRQTITWSHDLLDADEKVMFRRLAVFAAGWTLETSAVVGQVDEVTALALNAELLDGSLITGQTGGRQPRFAMLETVRAFAAEQLEASGEAETVRDRHAACYRDLALDAGRELWGPAQAEWLDRLQTEYDNLRVALTCLSERHALDDLAEVTYSLWMFWWIRGHLPEGRRWTERTLARGDSLSLSGRAKLLFTGAFMLLPQGRYEETVRSLQQAARLARDAQDLPTLCWILTIQGYAAAVYQPQNATAMLTRAEALSREVSNPHATSRVLVGKALVAFSAGRPAEADRILADCETPTRALGVPWSLALVLNNRGRILLELGEHARAEALLKESVTILGRLHDSGAIMGAFTHLANAAMLQSNPQRAARLFGAADAVRERNGAKLPVVHPFYRPLNQRCQAAATTELGHPTFETLHRQGREMPIDHAVAFAADPKASTSPTGP